MPRVEITTRVALVKLNPAQWTLVPLTILITNDVPCAADQIAFICDDKTVLVRATVPDADVRTDVTVATVVPRLEHVPLRIWTEYVLVARSLLRPYVIVPVPFVYAFIVTAP
jgi:hypothetical protein